MKNYITVTILIIYSSLLFSQQLSEGDKNWILSNLNSDINDYSAIEAVVKYKLIEAEDSITKYIWSRDRIVQTKFVEALQSIGSTKAHTYALALLDTLENNPTASETFTDPLENKVRVTGTMFKLNDFSTVGFIFELLGRDKPNVNSLALHLLPEIIERIPQYSTKAKDELEYAVSHAFIHKDRTICSQ